MTFELQHRLYAQCVGCLFPKREVDPLRFSFDPCYPYERFSSLIGQSVDNDFEGMVIFSAKWFSLWYKNVKWWEPTDVATGRFL